MRALERSPTARCGTLEITDWIRADHGPNPARYSVTGACDPRGYIVNTASVAGLIAGTGRHRTH
jgi:hypothetical protein